MKFTLKTIMIILRAMKRKQIAEKYKKINSHLCFIIILEVNFCTLFIRSYLFMHLKIIYYQETQLILGSKFY